MRLAAPGWLAFRATSVGVATSENPAVAAQVGNHDVMVRLLCDFDLPSMSRPNEVVAHTLDRGLETLEGAHGVPVGGARLPDLDAHHSAPCPQAA